MKSSGKPKGAKPQAVRAKRKAKASGASAAGKPSPPSTDLGGMGKRSGDTFPFHGKRLF